MDLLVNQKVFYVISSENQQYYQDHVFQRILVQCIYFLSCFVFSFVKQKYIRIIAFVSIFAPLVIIVLLSLQLPYYYPKYGKNTTKYFILNELNDVKEIFIAFGSIFFIFTNHFYVFSLIKFYRNDSMKIKNKIMIRSYYYPVFIAFSTAFVGYIAFGEQISDFLILKYPGNDVSNDYHSLVYVSKIVLCLNLIQIGIVQTKALKDILCAFFMTEQQQQNVQRNFVDEKEDEFQYINCKQKTIIQNLLYLPSFVASFFIDYNYSSKIYAICIPVFIIYYSIYLPYQMINYSIQRYRFMNESQIKNTSKILILIGVCLVLSVISAIIDIFHD